MLNIKDLHKSYDMGETSLHVLKGINLKVEKGDNDQIIKNVNFGIFSNTYSDGRKNEKVLLHLSLKLLVFEISIN